MKATPQCPVCGDEMILREVAPCWDCGHKPVELAHFQAQKHRYFRFRIFGHDIELCDFCMVDFSSSDPVFFGRDPSRKIGLGSKDFDQLDRLDEAMIGKDLVCEACDHRLKFLKWLIAVRDERSP